MRYRGTTYEYCTACKSTQECSVDVARQEVTCKRCAAVLYRDRTAVVERASFPRPKEEGTQKHG